MQSLTIIPDVFDSKTWSHVYTTDIVEALENRYSKFPSTGRIYHKQISRDNDITPKNEDEIEELRTLPGPFYVVVAPGDPATLTYVAYALIAVVAIVAITNRPKIPTALNRNYQTASPNNALQARTNQARVNGRIPDIYGTVRSTPDLIALPYSIFIDHQEYEYCYMCVGRGSYDIDADTVRDGQTVVSKINGESVAIYSPFTSPNTLSIPQLQIGDPIDRLVISTVRSKSVNGQVLLAPNEGSDTKGYNNLVAFVYPNKIIASSANTAPTFLDDYTIGDIIVLRTTQIFAAQNDFLAGVDNPLDGNYLVRFSDAGTIEFDPSTPINSGTIGQYLEITTGDYIGKYILSGLSPTVLTLQSPVLTNANWGALVGTTAYISTTFKRNDLIYINFSGTYTLTNVEERTLTLESPANSQQNQSWIWMQGLNLGGGDDSYGHDGDVVTIGIGSDDDGWIGPFVLDVTTMNQVIANFIALNGLYRDNGSLQTAINVDIQVEATLCEADGTPLAAPIYFIATVIGSNASQSTRAVTLFGDLSVVGRYAIRARRVSPKDFTFVGTVVDEIKWRDVYASSPIGAIAFGNVTTVHAVTRATAQALAISERQLNMLVTRLLPQRLIDGSFGALVATNSAADIIAYICLDPKIGNRPFAEVNFDNIYDTIADVVDYFGIDAAGEFSYTFDNDNLSFEEMISTVAAAVFCTAHRRGRVIELTFEKATDDSTVLFNHRNKSPGSESRSSNFGAQNDNDGIEYDYVSPVDDAIVTFYVPEDRTAVNPQKIESVGIRSVEQAHLQAYRAYNKLRYRTRVTEFDATQESEIVSINSRILVADNTRPDTQDGEIESQVGLILKLSQPAVILPGASYVIHLQLISGMVEIIDITAGADPYHVVLGDAPSEDLSVSDQAAVKTLYQIVKVTETDTHSYLLTEKEPQNNFVNKLTAINYDARYYANDQDFA